MEKIKNKLFACELAMQSLFRLPRCRIRTKLNSYFTSGSLDIDPLGYSYSNIA